MRDIHTIYYTNEVYNDLIVNFSSNTELEIDKLRATQQLVKFNANVLIEIYLNCFFYYCKQNHHNSIRCICGILIV